MPRPQYNAGSSSFASQTEKKGFISRFRIGKKERRMRKEEQLAKMVINTRAEMEQSMIDELEGISFGKSKLPKEYIEYKTDPEKQKLGDLEYATMKIAEQIKRSPNFEDDISEIDKRLQVLIKEFSYAVADGHVRAAYAAKGALSTCITKVRERIPNVRSDLRESFIQSSVKYLDTWIDLVDFSREADEIEANVKQEHDNYDAKCKEVKEKNEELYDKLKDSSEYKDAFMSIKDHNDLGDTAKWSPTMREVRKMLVDQRIATVSTNLAAHLFAANERRLLDRENKISTLEAKVGLLPIPEDPDAINKYNEAVNGIFEELARIDTETDEMLLSLEDIEGRLETLDNAPGAIHMRNVIAEQAENFLNNIKKNQDAEVKTQNNSWEDFLRRNGIRSEEEQKEYIRQSELSIQQNLEGKNIQDFSFENDTETAINYEED